MGNYIGRDVPYGQFDTQVLTPNSVLTTFNLTYKISSAASIIVVLSGGVLQPNVQYSISTGGTQIVFAVAPTTGSTLYIIYLGRELGTAPVSGVNTGDQNIFSTISVAGQSNVVADTTSDTLTLVAGTGVSLTTNSNTDTITISTSSLNDGDKGDITVSGSGTTWTIDSGAVSYAKIQTVSGSTLLGRASGTAGSAQEITLGSNLFFSGTTLNVSNSFSDGTAALPSIFFTNNVSTGIFRPALDTLGFSTNGTEKVRITSTGRLGIGVTAPAAPLHVEGSSIFGSQTTLGNYSISLYSGTANRTSLGRYSNADGIAEIRHQGTGEFQIVNEDAAGFRVDTSNIMRLYIDPTGQMRISDGAEALPALSFINDIDTGIYRPSTNTIAISTNAIERLRITGSGQVGIGTQSPGFAVDVQGISDSNSKLATTRFSNDTTPVTLSLRKSRGATVGTNTIVQGSDGIGQITFEASNGTGYDVAASIRAIVDGAPGATLDMPGGLIFSTTPDGSATALERVRISSSGLVGINETSAGAQLQVTNGAADRKTVIIKGAASQTANILEIQNSSGTGIFSVDQTGSISTIGTGGLVSKVQNGEYVWLGTTAGTATAQTASATPAITSYVVGQKFRLKVGAGLSSTGSAATAHTININSLGVKNIVEQDSVNPTIGSWVAGAIMELIYDGTNFVITNDPGGWLTYNITTSNFVGISPTVVSGINAVEVSRFRKRGKIVTWNLGVNFTLSAGGNPGIDITPPVNASANVAATNMFQANGFAIDSVATNIPFFYFTSATNMRTSKNVFSATSWNTGAPNNYLRIVIQYECV